MRLRPVLLAFGLLVARLGAAYANPPVTVNATYYYHMDHLGGTHSITDGAGHGVQISDYWPYGDVRGHASNGMFRSRYRFTGQELDPETTTYNFKARQYGQHVGRMLSIDPATIAPNGSGIPDKLPKDLEDPQRLNGYSYVENRPLILTDPTGMLSVRKSLASALVRTYAQQPQWLKQVTIAAFNVDRAIDSTTYALTQTGLATAEFGAVLVKHGTRFGGKVLADTQYGAFAGFLWDSAFVTIDVGAESIFGGQHTSLREFQIEVGRREAKVVRQAVGDAIVRAVAEKEFPGVGGRVVDAVTLSRDFVNEVQSTYDDAKQISQ